ncbi:MAG TPA: ATP-binding protein [Spirochaetia bacterium]|nr:ATP-binding protein [Spirochaetia bacterium]
MGLGSSQSFRLLFLLIFLTFAALVATVVVTNTTRFALKDQEILVRDLWAEWNGLVSEAKSLDLPRRPLAQSFGTFQSRLETFRTHLRSVSRNAGFLEDPRVRTGVNHFYDGLGYGVGLMADIDGWVLRLGQVADLGAHSLRDLVPGGQVKGPSALLASWTEDRLDDLDEFFDQSLASMKDGLNDLLNTSLKEAAQRAFVVSGVLSLALILVLVVLLLRLRGLNLELHRQSINLEQMVLQRTGHLTRALEDLERTQNRLVVSAKLAVLGDLAAGVAHEVNTPLGAISSAGRTLDRLLGDDLAPSLARLADLGSDLRNRFFLLLDRSLSHGADLGIPDRLRHRAFLQRLRDLGVEDPEDQGDLWTDAGLWGEEDLWISLAPREGTKEVLALVCRFSVLKRMVGVVGLSAIKLDHVTSALRNYLEGGAAEAETEFSLRAEWELVLVLLASRLGKGISVSLEVPGDIVVRGMRQRLSQVWINLTSNAVQAMGTQGQLRIAAHRDGRFVRIGVEDNGPGVPQELQGRIFEPFFTTKGSGGGLGLGLDICRKIVELHGGQLSFTSQPGKTVFRIDLPLAPGVPE